METVKLQEFFGSHFPCMIFFFSEIIKWNIAKPFPATSFINLLFPLLSFEVVLVHISEKTSYSQLR